MCATVQGLVISMLLRFNTEFFLMSIVISPVVAGLPLEYLTGVGVCGLLYMELLP